MSDRDSLKKWEIFKRNLNRASSINLHEDSAEKQKRIAYLLNNFEEFCKYYFPKYASSEFSSFHKKSAKAIINNPTIYTAQPWSRDHAKSVLHGVFLPIYLKFRGELKNMLLVSWSFNNAVELLIPIKKELESNQRLIHDFGKQIGLGTWEAEKFVTRDGCSFRAIGAGQSPRGTRNEEARPDYILCDDIDHDDVVRNPKRLDKTWDWTMGALYGCLSIDGAKRFIVINNLIAKDSILARAMQQADFVIRVDILHKTKSNKIPNIKRIEKLLKPEKDPSKIKTYKAAIAYLRNDYEPAWKERFDILDCVYMIEKMGYLLSQREYFNNPIIEGKIFSKDWIQFKKLPPLKQCRFKLTYLDPGFKKTKTSDTKAWLLMALHKGEYLIYKVFCGQASVNEMIEWGYDLDKYVKDKGTLCQHYMEEVFLQSLLYDDFKKSAEKKYPLGVKGDKRKKPDKDERIMALSGSFERGSVFFNEAEKDNHHMVELINQILAFSPGSNTKKDGADALEGGKNLLDKMVIQTGPINIGQRTGNTFKL